MHTNTHTYTHAYIHRYARTYVPSHKNAYPVSICIFEYQFPLPWNIPLHLLVLHGFSQPRSFLFQLPVSCQSRQSFPSNPSRRHPQNPRLLVLRNDIWLPDSGQQEVFLSKEYKHDNFRFCFSSKVSKALEILFFSSPSLSSLDNFENTKIKHFPDVKCVELIILLMISLQSQTNFSWATSVLRPDSPRYWFIRILWTVHCQSHTGSKH